MKSFTFSSNVHQIRLTSSGTHTLLTLRNNNWNIHLITSLLSIRIKLASCRHNYILSEQTHLRVPEAFPKNSPSEALPSFKLKTEYSEKIYQQSPFQASLTLQLTMKGTFGTFGYNYEMDLWAQRNKLLAEDM